MQIIICLMVADSRVRFRSIVLLQMQKMFFIKMNKSNKQVVEYENSDILVYHLQVLNPAPLHFIW